MAIYPYAPLNAPAEIRILVLQPGEYDDPLIGSLVHVSPKDHPQYDAISYCWSNCIDDVEEVSPDFELEAGYQNEPNGEITMFKMKYSQMANHPVENVRIMYYAHGGVRPSGELTCDGHTITIGGELHSALKRFRRTDQRRSLWADAICIHQNDSDEKISQIQAMSEIYSGAQMVLVWLGESIVGVWQADQALGKMSEKFAELYGKYGNDTDSVAREFRMDPEMEHVHWDSIAEVLRRAWFKRIWCLQEIVHARKAQVQLGCISWDWESFASLVYCVGRLGLDANLWAQGEAMGLTTVSTIRVLRASEKKYDIRTLLTETRQYKSTLPSDKLYAFFSLMRDEDKKNLKMSYSIPPEDLYREFVVQYILKHKSLSLLYDCFKPWGTSILSLPSWVPDWTQTQWHEGYESKGLKCKASLDIEPQFNFSRDHKTLSIRGRIVDAIGVIDNIRPIPWSAISLPKHDGVVDLGEWRADRSTVTQSLIDNVHIDQSSHTRYNYVRQGYLNHWLRNTIKIAFPNREATPEQYEMLWRTFMCNQTLEGEKPGAEWEERFNLWVDINTTAEEDIDHKLQDWDKPVIKWDLRGMPGDESRATRINRKRIMFSHVNGCWCYNRRFFRSLHGRYGWCPDGVDVGDKVVVVDGLDVPLVLKEVTHGNSERTFEVRGDCYIHGLMDGEALSMDLETQTLQLV